MYFIIIYSSLFIFLLFIFRYLYFIIYVFQEYKIPVINLQEDYDTIYICIYELRYNI